MVHQHDFSQFPVFSENVFVGLLTENGITRWLSDYVKNYESIIELRDAKVEDVIAKEENFSNYRFVERERTLDEIVYLFVHNPLLEAVFVTQSGKKAEKLLGIATRWDIIHKIE